ncbi:acyl-homoserine-lactone synthase [Epibacterium ulvae]|uniref:acyl-homoserine-lactone synthase n=1 Tax=Epibacterium ulvae TaxID=1156985 RepID=UPI0024907F5F|nr:acyl-homoserine-lactone synthase [Epibacterium ulvae]
MDISTTVVDLTDPSLDSALYVACLKLRQDVFISGMNWNLSQRMGCEFDQYDTPASIHIAAVDGQSLLGCIRMIRTDHQESQVTYMILDAHLGRIPNLPADILSTEVREKNTWECSRLAISHKVKREDYNSIFFLLIRAAIQYAESQGASSLLGMMDPSFERVFKRQGINAYRFGPIKDQRDGRICVLRLDFGTESYRSKETLAS